jgi:signal transduction histidine kinase
MSSPRPIKLYHFLPILNWWHSPFKVWSIHTMPNTFQFLYVQYWNLNSIDTWYIPIFSCWLALVWAMYLVLQLPLMHFKVMWNALVRVGMQIVLILAIGFCLVNSIYLQTLSRASRTQLECIQWTRNVSSVLWNASSVNTVQVPKKLLECVLRCMLQNFKKLLKVEVELNFFMS